MLQYQFMPELLIFVTLYSVYKTHIESGEYPMIKSWFQCLDKSDAVFKFMGDSTVCYARLIENMCVVMYTHDLIAENQEFSARIYSPQNYELQ